MKRAFRLTRSSEFTRVRRFGKPYAHPLVVLIKAPNEQETIRIGISASKAVGNAVKRNQAKRRIRACMSEQIPFLKTGWDLAVLARQPMAEASYSNLRQAILELLARSNMLKEKTEDIRVH